MNEIKEIDLYINLKCKMKFNSENQLPNKIEFGADNIVLF